MKRRTALRFRFWLWVIVLALGGCQSAPQAPDFSLVNLNYLDRLCRPVNLPDGEPAYYMHYSTNRQGELAGPGPYGIGRIDDAGRALLAYLRWHELTGDTAHARQMRGLVTVLLYMQAEDGRWYRWFTADGRRAGEGEIENPGIGNGAAKAVWALGRYVKVGQAKSWPLVREAGQAVERTLLALRPFLEQYPNMETIGDVDVPRWLPNGSNADVASELLLGLVAYQHAGRRSELLQAAIDRLTAGIAMMQQRREDAFAYGAHLSYRTIWHAWSNAQVQALVAVHQLTQRPEPLLTARREAEQFYPWLLEEQFADRFDWLEARNNRKAIDWFPQRPEHVRPVVLGCLALFEATGEKRFAEMAGRAARWLLGDNAAHEAVYDPETGGARAWIQARNSVRLEISAGATAEALLMLMEVGRHSEALKQVRHN
ncbi:MAG: hypothetical protein Q9P90_01720 [candidate division KSB1 bacterium]|nr:hypothetical protein [candidate division KSB1 bacterium]